MTGVGFLPPTPMPMTRTALISLALVLAACATAPVPAPVAQPFTASDSVEALALFRENIDAIHKHRHVSAESPARAKWARRARARLRRLARADQHELAGHADGA